MISIDVVYKTYTAVRTEKDPRDPEYVIVQLVEDPLVCDLLSNGRRQRLFPSPLGNGPTMHAPFSLGPEKAFALSGRCRTVKV